MEKHGEFYTCKRLRLLNYLLQKGHEPVQTVPDATNWRYKNWLFKNNDQLDADLDAYFSQYIQH